MLAVASTIADRPTTVRSAVTNGSKMIAGVDGRSSMARRFRDLVAKLSEELGGPLNLSTSQLGMVRTAAALTLQAESIQAAVVRGEAVDVNATVRLANASRRIMATLGIVRPDGPTRARASGVTEPSTVP